MITNILFALGGGIAGFLVCAFFCGGRTLELLDELDDAEANAAASRATYNRMFAARSEAVTAHTRCADALTTLQRQRDTIRSIISGNKTVRTSRIAEVIGDA